MSGLHERQENLISDTTKSTSNKNSSSSGMIDEDKFYDSSKTDSGFISGGNLTVSGEIFSSDEENNTTATSSSNVKKLKSHQQQQQQPSSSTSKTTTTTDNYYSDNIKISSTTHMRVDSGVDLILTDRISSLSLDKDSGYNDLDSTLTSRSRSINNNNNKCNIESINKSIEEKQIEEQPPWELYFEQDEDGNT